MASAEVTQRRDGVAGSWHADCAEVDYKCETAEPPGQDLWIHSVLCDRLRVINRHNGIGGPFGG